MSIQVIPLLYVRYVITAPRVLKAYPQFLFAYADSSGTNCVSADPLVIRTK